MKTLASRLVWARTEKKLSQDELAKKIGVSQGAIGHLELGTRLSSRKITALADALGVNALWLAEGKGDPSPSPEAQYKKVIAADASDERFVQIQKVKLRLSAGITGFHTDIEHDNGSTISIERRWIERKGFAPEHLVAVKVKGESMEPALYEDDVVLINTADTKLQDGVVYSVNY
jgi:phage repressor protein C with HTH and peptisase S24 domain